MVLIFPEWHCPIKVEVEGKLQKWCRLKEFQNDEIDVSFQSDTNALEEEKKQVKS